MQGGQLRTAFMQQMPSFSRDLSVLLLWCRHNHRHNSQLQTTINLTLIRSNRLNDACEWWHFNKWPLVFWAARCPSQLGCCSLFHTKTVRNQINCCSRECGNMQIAIERWKGTLIQRKILLMCTEWNGFNAFLLGVVWLSLLGFH